MTSLYDRLGGAAAVDAAVDKFYVKVLADPKVNYFFDGVDMKKQRRMQKGFLIFAFGGPNNYTGKGMRAAHQKLVDEKGLNDTHYDAIVNHLATTLKEMGVNDKDIGDVAVVANSIRDDVLCRPKSLYDRLGGAPAVDAAVDKFYVKVLADPKVNYFFDGVDMKKQRRMQKGFLIFAFGGPNNYTGKGMRAAHQKLVDEKGLNDSHYDAIVNHLATTLKEMGVKDSDISDVAVVANSIRDDVLCRPKSLYDRLGGAPAVDAAVDKFYVKVLADPKVNYFFDGVDMKKQRRMQKGFLIFAFGGPNNYTGKGMRAAHQKLVDEKGLNDTHYDAIVNHLATTLKEMGVNDKDIGDVAVVANSIRDDVLCRPKSLYDRLGGAPAVDAAVDKFYVKVLADPKVNYFFDGVDMKKQRRMQKGFLIFAFGGPNNYTGKGMRAAHQKLVDEKGLNDSHYDAIVNHLATTLKEMGVKDSDISDVAVVANSIRDDVLCRPKSLYDRLGGAPAVDAAVDKFYVKVLADPKVNYFFDGVDMKKQRRMQKGFLIFAFGGPNNYTGKGMRAAHQKLVDEKGLNDTHYDAIVNHLATTLKEMGVNDKDIGDVAVVANSIRDDILCRSPKGKGQVFSPALISAAVGVAVIGLLVFLTTKKTV
ncbi:Group 1 truncated hemoglobin GlbN [Diplonema papillatum]|nr:Group 1 truncated hemoglobin GlbN [Diplonema papillatum]